jgi:hypothetical protein
VRAMRRANAGPPPLWIGCEIHFNMVVKHHHPIKSILPVFRMSSNPTSSQIMSFEWQLERKSSLTRIFSSSNRRYPSLTNDARTEKING